jgi:hypothetical protein
MTTGEPSHPIDSAVVSHVAADAEAATGTDAENNIPGSRVIAARRPANPKRAMIGLLVCAAAITAVSIASAVQGPVAGWKAPAGWWPFLVLIVGVGSVITLITVVRMPAFLALVLAAFGAGLMARVNSLPPLPSDSTPGELAKVQPAHWTQAVELTTVELGHMTTKIGLIIALAAVIGTFLLESGAADKVVRRCLAVFGEKRAALAILVGTYIVSIPIFFDTIFMLLIPLVRPCGCGPARTTRST